MRRKIQILLSVGFLAVSPVLYAADYVGMGRIKMMQNAFNTNWIMYTEGLNSNPDSCTKNIVMLESDHMQFKEVYGFLLTAYITRKPVNLYVDGCTAQGYKKFSFVYTAW